MAKRRTREQQFAEWDARVLPLVFSGQEHSAPEPISEADAAWAERELAKLDEEVA